MLLQTRVALALALAAGCSTDTADGLEVEQPPAKQDGTERVYDLYPDRDRVVVPTCDHPYTMTVFTNRVGGLSATIHHRLRDGSICEITPPGDSYYAVFYRNPAPDTCGVKTATLRFAAYDPEVPNSHLQTKAYDGTFTDYGEIECEPVIPSEIVLDLNGFTLFGATREP